MQNRKIVLDTETTGFHYNKDDRIVEIAAIELIDGYVGNKFHYYVNPMRNIPLESTNVHGITDEKVKGAPIFENIVEELLSFIGDSQIVAHNAEFDRNFINAELKRVNKNDLPKEKFIDTLVLARQKFGLVKNTLDELCKRFSIDATSRKDYHGALIDTVLLSEVFKHLTAEQKNIFDNNKLDETSQITVDIYKSNFPYRSFNIVQKPDEEKHNTTLQQLNNAIWLVNSNK